MEGTGPVQDVQQHGPTHTDAVTSVAALKPDLCVSGGRDKVRYPLPRGTKDSHRQGNVFTG